MADQKSSIRVLLGYKLDRPSFDEAVKANQVLAASSRQLTDTINTPAVKKLKDDFAGLSPRIAAVRSDITSAQQALDAYGLTIDTVDSKTKAWDGDLSKLRASIVGVKSAGAGGIGDVGGSAGGGTPGGGINLSRIGSSLRQLPSTPIPGTGLTSDAVANLIRTAGAVQMLASNSDELKTKVIAAANAIGLGKIGAVGAIAGLAVGIKLLQASTEEATKAAQTELDARKAALTLVVQGDQQAIQSRLNVLATEKTVREAQAADAALLLSNYRAAAQQQFGLVGATIGEIDAVLGTNNGELIALKNNAAAAAKALNTTSTEMDVLTAFTGRTAQTTEQAAKAEEKLNLARGYGQRQQQAAADALELLNLAATGTEKQVRDLIAAKEREIQVYTVQKKITDDDLAYLDKKSAAYESGKAAADAFQASIVRDTEMLKGLTGATLDAAIANDRATEVEKIKQDQIALVKKYDADVVQLNESTAEKQTKLYQDLADNQVAIGQKAVDDSVKVLADLQDKEATLKTNLLRSLDDQQAQADFAASQRLVKFQRTEIEQEAKTRDKLLQIAEDGKNRELELGLDRSFSQIAASRRATSQQLLQANKQAQDDRAARLQAYGDANTDQEAQFLFERQNKLTQYQRQFDDAEAAEKKQLDVIEANKQKQLQAASDKFNREYGLLSAAYANQLTALQRSIQANLIMTAEGNAGLVKLNQQYFEQVAQIIKGNFTGIATSIKPITGTGGNTTSRIVATRSVGGKLNAGQSSWVNEDGSSGMESFTNSSGQTWDIPSMGIFTPYGGGNVNANSNNRSINLSMPIYVQGVDAKAVLAEAGRQADKRIAYTVERMNARTA